MYAKAIIPRQKRARTRSTAFWLALAAFATVKLAALGALDVTDWASDGTEGMVLFDLDCAGETTAC
jgi:hypothetical protein